MSADMQGIVGASCKYRWQSGEFWLQTVSREVRRMLAAKTHKMQTNTASTVAKDPTKPASKIGPSPPHSLPAPQPDGRPAPARSLPVPQPDGRPDPLFASGGGWARTRASRPGGPRGSWDFGRIAINAPTGPANAPSGSARASDHFAPFRV